MRLASLAFLILLGAQQAPPERKKPPITEEESLRIERALFWITDRDPELRDVARKQLVQFGPKAVSAIEERLKVRGVLDLVNVLRKIERPAQPYVTPEDLARDGETVGKNGQADPKGADAYLRVKYREALEYAHRKRYQRGYDLADAIVTLEPKWAEAEKAKKLRRYCDHMILQTTLLEATVVQDRLACVEGQAVELTLRMKNLFRSDLTVRYQKGTPAKPGTGMAILQTEVELKELGGASFSFSSHEEIRFENEIPIAPGATWEKKYFLDTRLNLADEDQVRVISINAWSHPLEIETEGRKMTRRIQFTPGRIMVVPKKYGKLIDNPLESLQEMMDMGTVQEVFVCAQLLGEKDKERGTELLIQWMQKAESARGRDVAASILYHLTGQKLGSNPKKWMAWWINREKKNPR